MLGRTRPALSEHASQPCDRHVDPAPADSASEASTQALELAIGARTEGSIFARSSGKALDRASAWKLLRRLAKAAGLPAAERISTHSLRHTYATVALDEGVALRDAQDSMGHRDPRTTRLYDRSRHNHSRDATYTVAAAGAKG